MIKKITLAVMALGMFAMANAQITLTQKDMPKRFQQYVMGYIDGDEVANFDATTGGMNGSWDLSGLSISDSNLDTFTFISPNETGFKDSFPTANIVFTEGEDGVIMARVDENGLEYQGAVFEEDDTMMMLKFNDPVQMLKLPLTNGSANIDGGYFGIKESFGEPPFVIEADIKTYFNRSYIVDGYGTLKMPDNKDYDVLRLRIVEADSTYSKLTSPFGNETEIDVEHSYYYEFWAEGFGQPLAKIEVDSAHNDTSLYFEVLDMGKTSVGRQTVKTSDFAIYPNPAQDQVFLQGTEQAAQFSVVDIANKEVLRVNANNSAVNISELPSGIYMVQMLSADGSVLGTEKLMVR